MLIVQTSVAQVLLQDSNLPRKVRIPVLIRLGMVAEDLRQLGACVHEVEMQWTIARQEHSEGVDELRDGLLEAHWKCIEHLKAALERQTAEAGIEDQTETLSKTKREQM